MKRLFRGIMLALALAAGFSIPFAIADEIPLEKTSSGTWSVEYNGQHFRVNSTAPVKVRFEQVSPTEIKLTFLADSSASGRVSIYWVEFQKYVYNGPIPQSTEPWEGTLNTEGGFVDR
jgi:hypothetical protein